MAAIGFTTGPARGTAADIGKFSPATVGTSIKTMPGRYGMKAPIYADKGYKPKMEYATGGIARGPQAGYPAVLHGTEAVVPMPHGSIPVEFKGDGASNNNVTVNVTMNSDGTASSRAASSGPDASALGNAVAKAVQLELQQQQRAGGMLSPYGVA